MEYGSVFELPVGSHTITTLATFNNSNGAFPVGGLISDAGGNLFGTTNQGGNLTLNGGFGYGAVFRVAAGTHSLTALATFNISTTGAYPVGVIADANSLYGATN